MLDDMKLLFQLVMYEFIVCLYSFAYNTIWNLENHWEKLHGEWILQDRDC